MSEYSKVSALSYEPYILTNDFQIKAFINNLEDSFDLDRLYATRVKITELKKGKERLFALYNLIDIINNKYNHQSDLDLKKWLNLMVNDFITEIFSCAADLGFALRDNGVLKSLFDKMRGNDEVFDLIFNASRFYKIYPMAFYFYFNANRDSTKKLFKALIIRRIINYHETHLTRPIKKELKTSLFLDAKRDFEDKYM